MSIEGLVVRLREKEKWQIEAIIKRVKAREQSNNNLASRIVREIASSSARARK